MATAMIAMIGTGSVFAESDIKNTEVTYTVQQGYTWSVPTKITFTADNDTVTTTGETGTAANVQVTKNVIENGKKLHIILNTSNTFKISSSEGAELEYTVKVDQNENVLTTTNNTVLDVKAGTNSGEAVLTFKLQKDQFEKAGTYTGNVTYEASVVPQD